MQARRESEIVEIAEMATSAEVSMIVEHRRENAKSRGKLELFIRSDGTG